MLKDEGEKSVELEGKYGEDSLECDVKSRLEEELKRLQNIFGLALDLHVVWAPGHVKYNVDGNPLSGEVRGNVIVIFDEDPEMALETLKHEFLDYVISHEIEEPYKDLINRLIDVFESVMYKRKERIIERLMAAL